MNMTIKNIQLQINHNLGMISPKRLEIIRDTIKKYYPIEGNASSAIGSGSAFTDGKSHCLITESVLVFIGQQADWTNWESITNQLIEKLTFDLMGYSFRFIGVIKSEKSFERSLQWLNNSYQFKEKIPELGAVGLRLFLPDKNTNDIAELKIEPFLEDRNSIYFEFVKGSTALNQASQIIQECSSNFELVTEKYVSAIKDIAPQRPDKGE
jgi:hypothetical protein